MPVADGRLERRRLPLVDRVHRLDVVVAVHRQVRLAGALVPLGDDDGKSTLADVDDLGLHAHRCESVAQPARVAQAIFTALGQRADRRNRELFDQVVEVRLPARSSQLDRCFLHRFRRRHPYFLPRAIQNRAPNPPRSNAVSRQTLAFHVGLNRHRIVAPCEDRSNPSNAAISSPCWRRRRVIASWLVRPGICIPRAPSSTSLATDRACSSPIPGLSGSTSLTLKAARQRSCTQQRTPYSGSSISSAWSLISMVRRCSTQ